MHTRRASSFYLVLVTTSFGFLQSAHAIDIFSDDYGTDEGRESYTERWEASPFFVTPTITDNPASFTASANDNFQLNIPIGEAGGDDPLAGTLTFNYFVQAGGSFDQYRMMFINANVRPSSPRANAWYFTVMNDGGGQGRLLDGWGGGTQLATLDPTARHEFSLSMPYSRLDPSNPLGTGLLSIDGGAPISIPLNYESDDTVRSFTRILGSSPTLTIDHASLSYTPKSAAFNDQYGTNPNRVPLITRWAPNPGIPPDSLTNNATSFTMTEASGDQVEAAIPVGTTNDGVTLLRPLTYAVSSQANANIGDVVYFFNNNDVNDFVGGIRSRQWAWTVGANGTLYDGFGTGGSVLATGLDTQAQHEFSLSITNPLTGNGVLSINGAGSYPITIGGESDYHLQAGIRMRAGSANRSLTVSNASLSFGSVSPNFDDDYGTSGGRVGHALRWEANENIGPSSLTDNAVGFTATGNESGQFQVQIPVALTANGAGVTIEDSFTYEVSGQSAAGNDETRYVFYNTNVNQLIGGFPTRQWAWTLLSDGSLLDGFGEGNVLTVLDPLAHHDFVLTVEDPLAGIGLLDINGGDQNFVIPIGNESDRTLQAAVRFLGFGSSSVTIDHAALTVESATTPGDYNDDGVVDILDYVVLRMSGLDYDVWRANYGAGQPGNGSISSVPEPGSALLLAIAGLALSVKRRAAR